MGFDQKVLSVDVEQFRLGNNNFDIVIILDWRNPSLSHVRAEVSQHRSGILHNSDHFW